MLRDRTLAVARAFAGDDVVEGGEPAGRAFVLTADVPRIGLAHLRVAALDLDEGGDVSIGATFDGGAYLVAMRDARPDLAGFATAGFAAALERAAAARLEVGMLRMERRLHAPADVAAMLADPLLPADVRAVLERPGSDAGVP